MKFIDEAIIKIKAGDGGDGCISFRREKYVPRGGPDGGNGGRGGHIIVLATSSMSTLMDLQYKKHFKAKKGNHGKGSDQVGAQGEDLILKVPVGTMIYNHETSELLGDLVKSGQELLLASGGLGGRGNRSYVSSTYQSPTEAQEGQKGESKTLRLELKLLADVGLVGLPNAGKSTFLSSVSQARPKIADYPFTTLSPVLGVVHRNDKSLTIADIPGLIEGAHTGLGLGIKFLKHIERTKIFLHLISLGPDESEQPVDRYKKIRDELIQFDPQFLSREEIIVLTKSDLLSDKKELKEIINQFEDREVFVVSSHNKSGVNQLLDRLLKNEA